MFKENMLTTKNGQMLTFWHSCLRTFFNKRNKAFLAKFPLFPCPGASYFPPTLEAAAVINLVFIFPVLILLLHRYIYNI